MSWPPERRQSATTWIRSSCLDLRWAGLMPPALPETDVVDLMEDLHRAQGKDLAAIPGLALRAFAVVRAVAQSIRRREVPKAVSRYLDGRQDRLPFGVLENQIEALRGKALVTFWRQVIETWVIGQHVHWSAVRGGDGKETPADWPRGTWLDPHSASHERPVWSDTGPFVHAAVTWCRVWAFRDGSSERRAAFFGSWKRGFLSIFVGLSNTRLSALCLREWGPRTATTPFLQALILCLALRDTGTSRGRNQPGTAMPIRAKSRATPSSTASVPPPRSRPSRTSARQTRSERSSCKAASLSGLCRSRCICSMAGRRLARPRPVQPSVPGCRTGPRGVLP